MLHMNAALRRRIKASAYFFNESVTDRLSKTDWRTEKEPSILTRPVARSLT